ncbi:hypothetical protein BH10ACI2_BH10ACI2_09050 [soil metagenome]
MADNNKQNEKKHDPSGEQMSGGRLAPLSLKDEKLLYQAILSNIPDFIYVLDLQNRFIYANDALLKAWGKTWNEAIGKTRIELGYDTENAEIYDRKFEQVVATKSPMRGAAPASGPLDSRFYDYIFVPLFNEHGEVEAIAGTSRDITEHKKSEEAFKQLAALVELSHEPIFVWELETGIVEWNRGAESLYGFTRSEAVGRISHELLKTRHPDGFDAYVEELNSSGFWSGELYQTTKVGTEVIAESRQQMIVSNGRRLILESNRSINERKQAESTLNRYRLLSERSRDVIWFLRPDGKFSDVNQAAIEAYGYSREEFLKIGLADVRHPSTLPDIESQIELAINGVSRFESMHVRKDGSSFSVDVTATGAEIGGEHLIMAIVRDITERKNAETVLRESEERRKLAQRAGNVGVWDWDARSGRTYWSETMWSIYGVEGTDRNPDNVFWSDRVHVKDRDRVTAHLENTLETPEANDFRDEFRIALKDGTVRWIESVGEVQRDEAGVPTRMYGVNLDITTRRESEERIRLSENQLRLVTNAVPALIAYVDTSERYRFVNQKFTEWFGLPTDQIVGKKVKDILGIQTYRILKPRIDEVLSGHQTTFETALSYKVVGTRYVHVSYMPDIGVDGSVYGYYALTHDLTDLKMSQDLLRSSEDRIGLMMENMFDYAIFSMDGEGRINSWNKGAEIIFGYSPDEIIGLSCEVIFTAEDVAHGIHLREMRTARLKGRSTDDRWHVRKDGTRFYASGIMMPLYIGQALAGYAKIARDLTEKQRHAEELQQAHDELEVRVAERTQELAAANRALVEEMEEREATERQKTDLLQKLVNSQELERRRIARDLHDTLGQRLTALRLKIQSLKEFSSENDQLSKRVERLQEIAEKLDSEVSFLAWELRPSALDDLGLVDAVGAFVNEWSRHYDIQADFHSAGLVKERLGKETETHLYRITQEALNNILKHAEASSVTVQLERRDHEVILIIEDDGLGFNPESRRPASESGKGLGLIGMSERATLVGGEVEIESAPGSGTAIYVRVPIAG